MPEVHRRIVSFTVAEEVSNNYTKDRMWLSSEQSEEHVVRRLNTPHEMQLVTVRFHLSEVLPPYEEAIKSDSMASTSNNSNHLASATPIHSISLSVDQAESVVAPRELPHPKAST